MTIQLGFELGTYNPVNIPLRHTAVTGQTQESGKTTTLEAMISRSGLRAVCFVTKRGEQSFSTGRAIMPYFQESADWRFVEAILEATMREGMKFNRSWIIKLCSAYHGKDGIAPTRLAELLQSGVTYFDAMQEIDPSSPKRRKVASDVPKVKDFGWQKPKTLADVALNVEIALLKARGLSEGVYTELREYLRIVVPQIKALPKTDSVDLKPGVNVMWLDEYSSEMQALIIKSVLEWITDQENRTVTVIPEAAMLLPQQRSSPVLLAAEKMIRQGAVNNNWIWLDSQDIAGVNKVMLRQCGVWILGRQREVHEAERTLDHLPGGLHKPKLEEIMKLGKGQFYVAFGDEIRKTYVWPVWLTADEAMAVAYTKSAPPPPPARVKRSEDAMFRERAEKAEQELLAKNSLIETQTSTIAKLNEKIAALELSLASLQQQPQPPTIADSNPAGIASFNPRNLSSAAPTDSVVVAPSDIERADEWIANVWPLVRDSILKDPATVKVLTSFPEIQIAMTRHTVELSDGSLKGKLAILISEGFFDQGQAGYTAFVELKRRGARIARPSVFNELNALAQMGIVTIERNGGSQTYKRVTSLKVTKTHVSTQ